MYLYKYEFAYTSTIPSQVTRCSS